MKIIRINAVWCSGCLAMKKIWREIEKNFPELDIVDYDYDFDKEAKEYGPQKVLPVIIFQKNNNEKILIGEQKKEKIIELIESM